MKVERDGLQGFALIPETTADKAALTNWLKKSNTFVAFVQRDTETEEKSVWFRVEHSNEDN